MLGYMSGSLTTMPAAAVLGKLHKHRRATEAASAVKAMMVSLDFASWSPQKAFVHEATLARRWASIFSGSFMTASSHLQEGFAVLLQRRGLCCFYDTHSGGWQGQDGRFSTAYHEVVDVLGAHFAHATGRFGTDVT